MARTQINLPPNANIEDDLRKRLLRLANNGKGNMIIREDDANKLIDGRHINRSKWQVLRGTLTMRPDQRRGDGAYRNNTYNLVLEDVILHESSAAATARLVKIGNVTGDTRYDIVFEQITVELPLNGKTYTDTGYRLHVVEENPEEDYSHLVHDSFTPAQEQ